MTTAKIENAAAIQAHATPIRFHPKHGFLPAWVRRIPIYAKDDSIAYSIRARIAAAAARDDAEQAGAVKRQIMTATGAPDYCPRRACRRTKTCSTPQAYCLYENLDAVQEHILPLLKRTGAGEIY